jgi:lipoprotein-releasing system permease protein
MDYRLLIARRYLISPRRISLISIITSISIAGVTLGVAALIVVLSVMNGFYDLVRDMLVSFDPHVRIVSAEPGGISRPERLMATVLENPSVDSATPFVEGKALFAYEGPTELNKVVIVRGVDTSTLAGVSEVAQRVTFGTFDLTRRDNRPGLVVGANLAAQLGLFPESEIRSPTRVALLSAAGLIRMATMTFGLPPISAFEVRGLYELEAIYDQSHVFVAIEEAQRLFRMDDNVTGIELRLTDMNQAESVKQELQQVLPEDQYDVLTWYDLQKSLYDVMRLEKWGASAILALIIVVAAFNIIGSLTMIVIEKRRDLAVLQAMGVSRRSIRRIFVLEGLLIGAFGSIIGTIIGLGLAILQKTYDLVPLSRAESFIIDAYPVAIQISDVLIIVAVAMGLCIAASLYPASRAAAANPALAVRNT